jgi:uncharacterized protein (TIGR00299 family) protein
MNVLYLDCFSGISGDMMVGALLDLGLDMNFLKAQLMKLGLGKPEIRKRRLKVGDILCTNFCLKDTDKAKKINFRSKKEIFSLLDKSSLDSAVKCLAKEIFLNLFKAESLAHGEDIDDIKLNELADMDSIVDIVSTAVLVTRLNLDKVYSSRIFLGRGFVKARDGILPVPAPATLELLKGMPVTMMDIEHELVTPTGASILKSIVTDFNKSSEFMIKKIGYGAASTTRKDSVPNVLRIMLAEEIAAGYSFDEVFMVEANLDDSLPLSLEYVIDKLLKEGALDAFLCPIIMKKSRPANLLTVIVEEKFLERIISVIFEETTTFGLRYFKVKRQKLQKEIKTVKTPYGKIKVKIGSIDGKINTVSPEYEDCKNIATALNIPLRRVYEVASDAFKKEYKNKK